ncbi:thrombospondin type 3 repeat-containing protein [Candidatus Woesearchaeota archaeon]|nr:thrombospondin type 3 repeat-containing protein [Candidatus Woesearchaeota archaeon]
MRMKTGLVSVFLLILLCAGFASAGDVSVFSNWAGTADRAIPFHANDANQLHRFGVQAAGERNVPFDILIELRQNNRQLVVYDSINNFLDNANGNHYNQNFVVNAGARGIRFDQPLEVRSRVTNANNARDTLTSTLTLCPDLNNNDVCDGPDDVCEDRDNDNTCDEQDNCPADANENQADQDNDNVGDACDDDCSGDDDNDNLCNEQDNCPDNANENQADRDGDGIGDACDRNNPPRFVPDPLPDFPSIIILPAGYERLPNEQFMIEFLGQDADNDELSFVFEDFGRNLPGFSQFPQTMIFRDLGRGNDNARWSGRIAQEGRYAFRVTVSDGLAQTSQIFALLIRNPPQCADADGDGICDEDDVCRGNDAAGDRDRDGICDNLDNCPANANPNQADADGDGVGDVCDVCPQDAQDQCNLCPQGDQDRDGICDNEDNCPAIPNPNQADQDGDGIGDVCDICVLDPNNDADGDGLCANIDRCDDDPANDADRDGICGNLDNCPAVPNPNQEDLDGDRVGDACDICFGNNAAGDVDGDGICGNLDQCVGDDAAGDQDRDGICNNADNCPANANPNQEDLDNDGIGDACDMCRGDNAAGDIDRDGICGNLDQCPGQNDQIDANNNGIPDCLEEEPLCPQGDQDNDGVCDNVDNCPAVRNPNQEDDDNDGIGNVCDICLDIDGDGICANIDNCPNIINPDQADADGDGIGDACDICPEGDVDGDGICGGLDNCPNVDNQDQADANNDGIGDACDVNCPGDADADGICDNVDNCPAVQNRGQEDLDNDGIGDACDLCIDVDQDDICDNVDPCPNDQNNQCNICPQGDQDNDGVCDNIDNCPAVPNPNQVDVDGDGIGNACDVCPVDAQNQCNVCPDADNDGVCDNQDQCIGDDRVGDRDNDGICDDRDICPDLNDDENPNGIDDANNNGIPDCLEPGQGNNGPVIVSRPIDITTEHKQYAYDVIARDDNGDQLVYSLREAPAGMTIDQQGHIHWEAENEGTERVIVEVTDGQSTAVQQYSLRVRSDFRGVQLSHVSLTEEFVQPGDHTSVTTIINNEGSVDLEDLRVTVAVPQLGFTRSSVLFDLDNGESDNREVVIQVPYGTPNGQYLVKVTAKADAFHEVAYRYLTVDDNQPSGWFWN